ncbi:MAG: rhodanese-like domain-containing protein [Sedimenticolaceae bacterium]
MNRHLHVLGATLLILASAGLAWRGQPDPDEKWTFLAAELGPRLSNREVQIDPAELMDLMHDDYIDLRLIDLRNERDWNLFHLWGAERIAPEQLPGLHRRFANLGENAVIVLVGNDEAVATRAWQVLMATASRPNAYILAGGINRWLDEFAPGHAAAAPADNAPADETLRHSFEWAMGSRHPAALPDPHHAQAREFSMKVKLQKKVVKKGGCG